MQPEIRSSTEHDLTRRHHPRGKSIRPWLWTLGFTAAILYGSLIPFNFLDSVFRANSPTNGFPISYLRWDRPSLEDAMTNLLLYVPLGAMFFLWSPLGGRSPWSCLALTGFLGLFLSFGIELAQTGVPSRVPSWIDIFLNTSGAVIGATLSVWLRPVARTKLLGLREDLNTRPLALMASSLTVGLIVFHLIPFDFVTNTTDLHAAFLRSRSFILPDAASVRAADVKGFLEQASYAGWFALLGYVAGLSNLEARRSSWPAFGQAVVQGIVVTFLIAVMRLFTVSGVFDPASMSLQVCAVLLGAWAAVFLLDEITASAWKQCRRLVAPTAFVAGLVLLQMAWMTLSIITTEQTGPAFADHYKQSQVPFVALWRQPLQAVIDLVASNVVIYGSLTLTLVISVKRLGLGHHWIIGGAGVVATAIMMELLRSSVGSKIDLTNVVLAVVTFSLLWEFKRFLFGKTGRRTAIFERALTNITSVDKV